MAQKIPISATSYDVLQNSFKKKMFLAFFKFKINLATCFTLQFFIPFGDLSPRKT